MNLRASTSVNQQTVVGLGLVALSLLLAYEIGGWIAGEDLRQVEYVFVAAAVAVASVAILRNWRTGFYIFLTWVVFEDAVRKYLGNNMLIYFAKDFLVLLIYFALYNSIRNKRDRIFRPPFLVALSLFFWWAVIQVLNPNSPSYLYGLLGLKIDFFYAPLMLVGYALIRTDEDLQQFLTTQHDSRGYSGGPGSDSVDRRPQFPKPCNASSRNPRTRRFVEIHAHFPSINPPSLIRIRECRAF